MAKVIPSSPIVRRDGTSQRSRRLAALDPDHARVDERSILDFLAFAREHGKQLVHHGLDNTPDGDFSEFLGPRFNLEDLAKLAGDPSAQTLLSDETLRQGVPPHVALFLAFLKLVEGATMHLDMFTRRHLDFYYRDLLGLAPRGPVPDRVHVLGRLARGRDEVLLRKGTLLDGGKDSQGKVRAYATEKDVVLNRTEIKAISSVFVERRVTTIRSAREENATSPNDALMEMMKIALGDPRPGDALPDYQGTQTVDVALLHNLETLVTFAKTNLHLELYELGHVLELLGKRTQETTEWAEINATLQTAGRARRNNPTYTFSPTDPDDFKANVNTALGDPPLNVKVLADVLEFEDLYHQRGRADVQAYITTNVCLEVATFTAMMQKVLRIEAEWREINRILELCSRRKRDDQAYLFIPTDRTAFDQNLAMALDVAQVDWSALTALGFSVSSLAEYQQEFQKVEAAFFMTAGDFAFVMAVSDAGGPTEKEWTQVYEILAQAYGRKDTVLRRAALKNLIGAGTTLIEKLALVLRAGLGAELALPEDDNFVLVEKLRPYLGNESELQFLRLEAVAAAEGIVISSADWERIAVIVEVAQRRREGWKQSAARKTEWLDLHVHHDATVVQSTLGIAGADETPRWKTFGTARVETDPERQPHSVLGWAISSPLLAMREGRRTIVLTLGFDAASFDAARVNAALAEVPFEVTISTAKGYQQIAAKNIVHGDYQTLAGVTRTFSAPLSAIQFEFEMLEDFDSILPEKSRTDPSLRLRLRPVWDANRNRFVTRYEAFDRLVLNAVHVQVKAYGLRSLALENDAAVVNSKKPFTPFGPNPAIGSRFYVAHPELCGKRLDTVRFHVKWMKAPADLTAHYAAYSITPDFKARIALLDGNREHTVFQDAPLFASSGAQNPHTIEVTNVPAAMDAASSGATYAPLSALGTLAVTDRPASTWTRAIVWELVPLDFQHAVYPGLASRRAAELTAAMAASATNGAAVNVSSYQVQAPYTPTLERLDVDYTASTEVVLDASLSTSEERVSHIHPFGEGHITLLSRPAGGAYFLPRHDEYEGELCIGLDNAGSPGAISLLFQLAEGSADPDLEPAAIEWSYLSGDEWFSLHHGGILADGTRGLLSTGILELSLPAIEPSTRLPGGLCWLRAAVRDNTRSICDIVAIHTQVVPATFVGHDNAPDVNDAPLPSGTITKILSPVPGVAGVEQPYASFGQSPAEAASSFSTRVSERLRHKQRALCSWDYERLVLQHFPSIYKAKCIPANTADPDAAGLVRIVVIPEMRGRIPFDPFAPKAPAGLLEDIATCLADKKPPQARLRVQNAVFIGVRVRILVRFRPGYDEGFYKKKLDDEICRFLSPWAYDEGVDIVLGNRIYASSIVDFVERRPYIDFVAGLTLYRVDGQSFVEVMAPDSGGYCVEAEQPDQVLVAARGHEIDTSWQYQVEVPAELLAELRAGAQGGQKGIGGMTVSLDFIIGNAAQSGSGVESMKIEDNFQIG